MRTLLRSSVACLIVWVMSSVAIAQVECSGWGELRGIRVHGELRRIKTTLCIAAPGWRPFAATAHWRTRDPKYTREGDRIISTGQLGFGNRDPQTLTYRQVISSIADDAATLDIEGTADVDLNLDGVYLFISVPAAEYDIGHGELANVTTPATFATTRPANDKHFASASTNGARFVSDRHQVEITLDGGPRDVTFQDDRTDKGDPRISVFFPVSTGPLKAGQKVQVKVTIKSTGEVDRSPATVKLDASQRGNSFAGLGGNFCWGTQSPVVSYYLDNMRVAWARVAMPLERWQPDEHVDPTTQPADQLHAEIRESLRMASELHRRGIPMVISVWNAPPWAMAQRNPNAPGDGGPGRRVGRIDPAKWDAFEKSVGSYLLNFKRVVGAEPELFGFNESDLGVNIRMSPEEHRDAIKKLGAHFASIGLRTRMLLGEAHEPRPVDYVNAAMADPDAVKYVGAVAYHSWNGGTDAELIGWREHAAKLSVPLLVTEAGTDPDAHRYPDIMNESWYALDEAAMYVRTLQLSQPLSMLHWQLTPDYGMVHAGANPDDPIRTTQRWSQFKQIDHLTPANARVIGAISDVGDLTVAALSAEGGASTTVVHLVNTGPARPITIIGLPGTIKEMRLVVSDAKREMQELDRVAVSGGSLRLQSPRRAS